MSTTVTCEYPGCNKVYTGDSGAVALGLLQLHQKNVHDRQAVSASKAPKVDRPRLSRGISAEEFATWQKRYQLWKSASGVTSDPYQLIACCDTELEAALIGYYSDIVDQDEETVMTRIKEMAVLDVAATVRVTELLSLKQQHGESARAFTARLRAKAQTCAFQVTCSKSGCDTVIQYTDAIVRYVLLAGLSSAEIAREVLGTVDIDGKSLTDTLTLIESKERAVRATASSSEAGAVAGMSAYRAANASKKTSDFDATRPKETIPCGTCGKETPKFGRGRSGRRMVLKLCNDCFQAKKKARESPKDSAAAVFDVIDMFGIAMAPERSEEPQVRQLVVDSDKHPPSLVNTSHNPPPTNPAVKTPPGPTPDQCPGRLHGCVSGTAAPECITVLSQQTLTSTESLDNYVYDKEKGWHRGDSKPQPTIKLRAQIDHSAYHSLGKSAPRSHPALIECISDSGAMSSLAPVSILHDLGLTLDDIHPVRRKMRTAVQGDIKIAGAVFLTLIGTTAHGEQHRARVMVYISPDAGGFYLSRSAMEQLGIISSSFPAVGAAAAVSLGATSPCGCLTRTPPPKRPDQLPFPASAENTAKMKAWLLNFYASSTFNRCPHQQLPTMTGPEMEIRTTEGCAPFITRRPARVPVHWREKVKQDLDRDVALGVIEKVPPGTPVTWLNNMVLSSKQDGSPRRTVDLQPVNKNSVRETHHTIPPFQQVRAIPKHQVMTCTDAWNGYHAIPIKEEDRHKTTFLTEYGRYRYCRAPMGFLASGDAYTHRYDTIVADIPRLAKVIDDSLLHDDVDDLETHWWRIIDYLERCGNNGIILNEEKFQFSQTEVDFTAFRVTGDEVKPLSKYLDAIKSFPKPSSITDIRAWFGLVNQVAHYGHVLNMMAPFKPLLSPKQKFIWSEELETAFQESKSAIIAAISEGLEIYDPARVTCLQTDYSGTGVGYWLRQKYCECKVNQPDCCPAGWKITLVGSRFLRDAEKRYAAIEGECLAVAWSLEDTRWFTLGCKSLIIATDHKPLLRILGDKSLEAIQNPRLFRLKQRTLMWSFNIMYVAGKNNHAADATSRNPGSRCKEDTLAIIRLEDDRVDGMEDDVVAAARSLAEGGVLTWHDLQRAQQTDGNMQLLHHLVSSGFPSDRNQLPPQLLPYWPYRDRLYMVDGVCMMDARIVIPAGLREAVLNSLHAAHQGISGMHSRAQDSVFWPGMTTDIARRRERCTTCACMAPSQPHMPSEPPITPEYPFQAIVGDYFELKGVKYLVVVDRFSGWPHVMRARYSDEAAGARGLIRCLRIVFATFGVPEELGSDGGPEFTADETEAFLERWGVRHRISSAYNPESNGRAEVGVKSTKRLLTDSVNADGSLDTDAVVSGLLQYRNTPEPTTGMSPAKILFGRRIRDRIPIPPGTSWFENRDTAPVWQRVWRAREEALRTRFAKQVDDPGHATRDLGPLHARHHVRLQNLCGNHPKKWDRTGRVTEVLPHDQYLVKMDGSGRVVRRNRRHIRQIETLSHPTEHTTPHVRTSPSPVSVPRQDDVIHTLPNYSRPASQTDTPTPGATSGADVGHGRAEDEGDRVGM